MGNCQQGAYEGYCRAGAKLVRLGKGTMWGRVSCKCADCATTLLMYARVPAPCSLATCEFDFMFR
jgi:hypothetical protein